MEATLAIIKPDAYSKAKGIERQMKDAGFEIKTKKSTELSKETCVNFYRRRVDETEFPNLVSFMSSGPVLLLVLIRPNAIAEWRRLIGPTDVKQARQISPTSLRPKYGKDLIRNALHGSEDFLAAQREIEFFFPEVSKEAKEEVYIQNYLSAHVTPIITTALTELCLEKPKEPILWLARWLDRHQRNVPSDDNQ